MDASEQVCLFPYCREISAAQDRLTSLLEGIFQDQPSEKELVRIILSTVGRGGEGDVGQRIRDEILVVQVSFSHCVFLLKYASSFRKSLVTFIFPHEYFDG